MIRFMLAMLVGAASVYPEVAHANVLASIKEHELSIRSEESSRA